MSTNKSPVSKPPLTNTKKDVSLVDIMNTLKIMRNEIQSINSKLLTQENTSTAILNRMDTLSTEIISLKNENAELKRDIEKLKTNSLEHTCSSNTANSFPGFDFVKEIQEREIKSRNILLFNVVESQDDEIKLATDQIKSLHIDVPITSAVRLGKQSNKPRPIRIEFECPQSVFAVLKSKKILSTSQFWKNIWITADLTVLQRSNLSDLKKERDRRNKTWLTNDIDSNELGMFDYSVFRNDRNDLNSDRSKGGGVLIAIHNRFCPNVLTLSNASLECLAVSFISSNFKIIIVAIYIPPNSSIDVYICQFAEIENLRLIFSDYTFIIVGDFNLPGIKWSNQTHAILSGHFSDKSNVFAETIAYEQFFQHNFIPNYRNNILDLVISDNNTLEVSKCSFPLIPVDVAHPPLQINGLNFVSSLKKPFPSPEPNFRRELKVTKDPLIYNEFSRLRSLCKRESKLINLRYLQKIQSNLTSDPKSFWRYINGLKTNNCIPQNMILGDKSSTGGPEVANLFKEFFSSVYSTDKLNIGECLGYSKNYADIYQVQPHIKFTVSEIFDAINSLDLNPCPGPDGIPNIMLRSCIFSLTVPLCILFNRSLILGSIPSQWKTSFITPIYKSGNKSLIANYRPIAKQSTLPKLLDELVTKALSFSFKTILDNNQHGFRKGRSVETNLLCFYNFLVNSMESGIQTDVIYTDFSKAFDSVNHSVLIAKLKAYGLPDHLLSWISSYLVNRVQQVKINGFLSNKLPVPSGVPQGGIYHHCYLHYLFWI
ncbi:hypothetical protein QTP88_000566 [Uroleucon formosanum]